MLEEAVSLGCEHLGLRTKAALLCEWEAYACACLLARMEEASLEPCPVWCGDLRDLDCRPFRGLVDIVCAGLPCQPYSCAGKRRGLSDERSYGSGDGPIPQFLRCVSELEPALVFLENVPAWVRGGYFQPVGEELSGLGYQIEDSLLLTAEAVGASHRRERVFILAHRPQSRSRLLSEAKKRNNAADIDRERGKLGQPSRFDGEQRQRQRIGEAIEAGAEPWLEGSGEPLVQSERGGGRQYEPGRGSDRRAALGGAGEQVGDASQPGLQIAERPELPGAERIDEGRATSQSGGAPLFAPGPQVDWRPIPEMLYPATEPGFRVLVNGLAVVLDESRADQLRCGGNGVVALAGAVAFIELVRRAGIM